MKTETWQNISGFGTGREIMGSSLKIELEVFTKTESGLKVMPTPGATMTITDKDGHSQSLRLIHSECEHVAEFLRKGRTLDEVTSA